MVEITTQNLHQTVHKAIIYEAKLTELAVAAVAAQLGLDALASHIEVKTNVYTPLHSDRGARIEVVLIDHHEGKPCAGTEVPADGTLSALIVGDGSDQPLPTLGT